MPLCTRWGLFAFSILIPFFFSFYILGFVLNENYIWKRENSLPLENMLFFLVSQFTCEIRTFAMCIWYVIISHENSFLVEMVRHNSFFIRFSTVAYSSIISYTVIYIKYQCYVFIFYTFPTGNFTRYILMGGEI